MQQERELMEVDVLRQQVPLPGQDTTAHKCQVESDVRVVEARVQEANAQTAKLMEEAEFVHLQCRNSLLRERNKLQQDVTLEELNLTTPLVTDL
jgi:hypothetical protein